MMWRTASQLPLAGRFFCSVELGVDPAHLERGRPSSASWCVLSCCLFSLLFCESAKCQSLLPQNTQTTQDSAVNEFTRRLEAALQARKSGDPESVGQASKQVIALGLAEMAKLRLDKRAYDEAAALCRESLEFEDTPETRIELAIASLSAKRTVEAIEQASIATERDPQNALAWNIKGEALLRNANYADAATALAKSVELRQVADSTYALGIAYLGMGEKQKAADTFSQMLALVGDYGRSRVLVGRAYQEQHLPSEAEVEFRTALRMDPQTPTAHYYWALTLLQTNAWTPTPEARLHLREELKFNPRHLLANYLLGYFASNEGNFEESDPYLRLAAEINPSMPETWMFLGLNAQARKSSQLAEKYFRKAIQLAAKYDPKEHPSIRKAYFVLGRILLSSGRKKEGEQMLQKVHELQQANLAGRREGDADAKGSVEPYLPESDARNSLSIDGDHGVANGASLGVAARAVLKSSQGAASVAEKHFRSVLGSSLNDLATAEALQEKYDLAVKHYREAEKWDAQIPGLQRNLGLAAFFVGEPDEAIRLLAKVVKATPSDAHARAVLGLAYFAKKDFAKVVQSVSPIADRAVQDPQLGFAWAKSLAVTGNRRAAARALETLENTSQSFSAESLTQFGQLWQELGEEKRAENSFRQALNKPKGPSE